MSTFTLMVFPDLRPLGLIVPMSSGFDKIGAEEKSQWNDTSHWFKERKKERGNSIQRLKGQFCFLVNPGCHARGVPQRDSRNPWEVTLDEFKDYFTDLSSKADGVVKDIKSSPVSRELEWVNLHGGKVTNAITHYIHNIFLCMTHCACSHTLIVQLVHAPTPLIFRKYSLHI